MTLGERIKELRKKAGMTQEELAKEIGYSNKTSISKIESDILDVNQSTIIALARALKTTPSEIMGWNEPETNTKANPSTKEELKFALFNGSEGITDEMYDEVKAFAELVKLREEQKKGKK